jgi:hypothetical protein
MSMREPTGKQVLVESPAFATMQQLLQREKLQQQLAGTMEIAAAQRMAVLERQAPEFIQAAQSRGVEIEYLGIGSIPAGYRYYKGADGSDWILGPATKADAVMPRREARRIERVEAVGLYFSQAFVGHQVPEDRAAEIDAVLASGNAVDPGRARALVGPIPPPADSVALGDQMATCSKQIADALRQARNIAMGAVTIPAEAARTYRARIPVDPVVLGAVPVISERPGAPAAWYMLAKWDW